MSWFGFSCSHAIRQRFGFKNFYWVENKTSNKHNLSNWKYGWKGSWLTEKPPIILCDKVRTSMNKPGKCVKFIIRDGPPKWSEWGYLFPSFKMSVESSSWVGGQKMGKSNSVHLVVKSHFWIICISWYRVGTVLVKLCWNLTLVIQPWSRLWRQITLWLSFTLSHGSNFCSVFKQEEVAVFVSITSHLPSSSLPPVSSPFSHLKKMRLSFHLVF